MVAEAGVCAIAVDIARTDKIKSIHGFMYQIFLQIFRNGQNIDNE